MYPSWCCQVCGKEVGWLGRFFDWLARRPLHKCEKPDRILVDREGLAFLPTREVKLKARSHHGR